jgi:hypothetical protein
MSLGLGEAVTAIEVVIELWRKVEDAQDEVDKMGKQLEVTKVKIVHAEQLVPKNKEYLLKETNISIWSSLQKTTREIQRVAQQAEQILRNWFNISSKLDGAQWTNKYIANFAAVVKQNPGKLRDLREELIAHQDELQSQIQMLILNGTLKIMEDLHKKRTQLQPSPQPTKPKSRSPSPRPPPKNIIFIDSYNSGRSVIAQSYMLLVREWTTRTKNHWPLHRIDSAGIRITARSAFAEQLKTLPLKTPITMSAGNVPASTLAVNALFDQPYFMYAYKPPMRSNATKRRSRGLPADLFSGYDHIFVFSREQRDILEALREWYRGTLSLEAKKASTRARIELLGEYGSHNKAEILAPNDGDEAAAKKWGWVVGNVKTSCKAFLGERCGWVTPKWKDGWMQGEKLTPEAMAKAVAGL